MSFKSLLIKTFLYLFGSKVFSKMLLQCEGSKTYRIFCQEVYGRDLCQANMVDEEQLEKLVAIANLKSAERVLDIGCGLGYTSEYLSDISGVNVLGIDFADAAVDAANKRTSLKLNRIQFQRGNLNDISVGGEKFDCILSIDTMYFVNSIPKTIRALKKLLHPGGQLLIFFSFKANDGSDEFNKTAENSELGVALAKNGFSFQAWDFTQNEREIWGRTKSAAKTLRDDFAREGNIEIYKGRISEAERNLKWQAMGVMSRYLYRATVAPAAIGEEP